MTSLNIDRVFTAGLTVAALALASVAVRRELLGPSDRAGAVRAVPPTQEPEWEQLARFGHWIGDSTASVRVVEFADFECPFCARFQQAFVSAMDSFPSALSLLVVQSPVSGHRFARPAAEAAECAYDQGYYAQYHHALYRSQDSLGLKSWTAIASDAGIADPVRFKRCVERGDTAARIDSSLAEARRRRVAGTPTIIINGWRYAEPPHDSLLSIVRALLPGQRSQ